MKQNHKNLLQDTTENAQGYKGASFLWLCKFLIHVLPVLTYSAPVLAHLPSTV